LGERLFLEAELPFFMLDTRNYPITTQGTYSCLIALRKKEDFLFIGDSIIIARQLFNKYHSSLNNIDLPQKSSQKKFPLKYI
jgi:hypothetical protein